MNTPTKRSKLAKRGFTLVELLIVIAILGIIVSIIVPNFITSINRARQRRTMVDISDAGKAIMSWMTDQVAAAAGSRIRSIDLAAFGPLRDYDEVADQISPQYHQNLPKIDAWGQPFEYYLNEARLGRGNNLIAIRSSGSDGEFSGDSYNFEHYNTTRIREDIVWTDGFFYVWPED